MDYINGDTVENAKELLGKKILIDHDGVKVGGYIVEVEAYLGFSDEAAHGYNGRRTKKVEAMFHPGGTIYVYTMHGHHCVNIVMKEAGDPQGVLIRAIEPTDGLAYMMKARQADGINLTNGPGKLTKALGITRDEFNMTTVNTGRLTLEQGKIPKEIIASPRIGIPNKGEWTDKPLRFYVAHHPYVSGMKKREMKEVDETWL